METVVRPVALITGGSRGIGAATALTLAKHGYDIVVTYRNKAVRAQEVATSIVEHGSAALTVQCDITQHDDLVRLFSTVQAWRGHLEALVLNASGGLERELLARDPDYPLHINRDAQLDLLATFLPLLTPGSVVTFVTSHWAHLHGRVQDLPAYAPISSSKYAGEQALRARIPELTARSIRLIVVTGDLIEDTITPKLLERTAPGFIEQRRTTVGALPDATSMGEEVAAATIDKNLPTGHTVVVGGSLDSL